MIPRRDPSVLAALKTRLRSLETAGGGGGVLPFGLDAIDGRLPRIGLHELMADRGSAAGVAAVLAGRALAGGGPETVLWAARQAELYGPGLAIFGLPPARLILVEAASD